MISQMIGLVMRQQCHCLRLITDQCNLEGMPLCFMQYSRYFQLSAKPLPLPMRAFICCGNTCAGHGLSLTLMQLFSTSHFKSIFHNLQVHVYKFSLNYFIYISNFFVKLFIKSLILSMSGQYPTYL